MKHDWFKLQNSYLQTLELKERIYQLKIERDELYEARTNVNDAAAVPSWDAKIKKIKEKIEFETRRLRAREKSECVLRGKMNRGYITFECDEDFLNILRKLALGIDEWDKLTKTQRIFLNCAVELGYLPYNTS